MKRQIAGAVLGGAALLLATSAGAEPRRHGSGGYADQIVVAHSRWGHGSVSGAVRRGRVGLEVRLPGGTWIPCVRSCSETLRHQTVDFWESNGRDALDGGPGYLQRWFRF